MKKQSLPVLGASSQEASLQERDVRIHCNAIVLGVVTCGSILRSQLAGQTYDNRASNFSVDNVTDSQGLFPSVQLSHLTNMMVAVVAFCDHKSLKG